MGWILIYEVVSYHSKDVEFLWDALYHLLTSCSFNKMYHRKNNQKLVYLLLHISE